MTESKLFLSSCDRRELTRRHGHGHGRRPFAVFTGAITHPLGFALALALVCVGGFVAGHGGL